MTEANLSRTLMHRMRSVGHFVRIENMVGVGHPDVSYCIEGIEGHIENKWRLGWPRDRDGIVTLDHYTPQQRLWTQARLNAGGRVYVFLQIEQPVTTYLLLRGSWAWRFLGKVPREDIERAAIVTGLRSFPLPALKAALTEKR